MRMQYLFLKFLRSFAVGLLVGLCAAAVIAVIMFAVFLAFY